MPDQVRVFISHHHSPDEDLFTTRVKADLMAAGVDVWVDDAKITSGDFVRKINEGLAGRQWLVLIMTPAALQSPWVQDEVNAALVQVRKGRMLGVIPLVTKPCSDAEIPVLWDALHRYDATLGYEIAVSKLIRAMGLEWISRSIVSVKSGKVLDVLGGSTMDGAPIIQYFSHGGLSQRWRFT